MHNTEQPRQLGVPSEREKLSFEELVIVPAALEQARRYTNLLQTIMHDVEVKQKLTSVQDKIVVRLHLNPENHPDLAQSTAYLTYTCGLPMRIVTENVPTQAGPVIEVTFVKRNDDNQSR